MAPKINILTRILKTAFHVTFSVCVNLYGIIFWYMFILFYVILFLYVFFSLNAFEWKVRVFLSSDNVFFFVCVCVSSSSFSSFIIIVIIVILTLYELCFTVLCAVIHFISFAISGMIENPKQIDAHLKLFSIYYVRVCVWMCFLYHLHLSIKSSYSIYLNCVAYVTQAHILTCTQRNVILLLLCHPVDRYYFTSFVRSSKVHTHTKNPFIAVDFRAKCVIRDDR